MMILKPRHFAAIIGLVILAAATMVSGQTRTATPQTPDGLVADLYRVHKQKRGPFFQTRSRALVDKYFARSLGDLIWKDARTSKGEVGVIDGDPLYDAQDFDIKKFAIAKPRMEEGRALVDATFENLGEKKKITYILVKGPAGWRIDDIVYGEGRTLRSEFKDAR